MSAPRQNIGPPTYPYTGINNNYYNYQNNQHFFNPLNMSYNYLSNQPNYNYPMFQPNYYPASYMPQQVPMMPLANTQGPQRVQEVTGRNENGVAVSEKKK